MDPQHTAKLAYTTPQSTTLGLQPVIRVPWSLLIYRPLRDGWLSWPCWLTDSGRLNHVQLSSLAQDRESSPADTSVITTILCRQIWSTRPTPSPLEQGSRLDDVTILLLRLLLIAEIWWQSASSWRWRCFFGEGGRSGYVAESHKTPSNTRATTSDADHGKSFATERGQSRHTSLQQPSASALLRHRRLQHTAFAQPHNGQLFLSRVEHAHACKARYCYGKSVRLSVCHTVVLYRNEYTHRQTFHHLVGAWH